MTHACVHLLGQYGYFVVVMFFIAEGVGIPFPAETMLVTAAAFAARGKLWFPGVVAAGAVGGIIGGSAGYWIGRVGGLPLVKRFGRLIHLDHEKLARAQEFFWERGTGAAVFCRFIPFLRIVIPMLIGLSVMRFARFTAYNAAGSIVAALMYGSLGYIFGRDLPTLMHHLALVSVVAIPIAALVGGLHIRRRRIASRRMAAEQAAQRV